MQSYNEMGLYFKIFQLFYEVIYFNSYEVLYIYIYNENLQLGFFFKLSLNIDVEPLDDNL